ncbi:MAG: translation initiation factor IF-2, partial [Planctomycetota bacterium]
MLEVCAEEGIEADGHASVLSPDEESLIVDILLAESVKEPKKKLKKKSSGKKKKKVVKKVKKKAEPEPEPEPEEQPDEAPRTTKKVVKKVIKKVRKVVRKKPAEQPAEATETGEAAEATETETPEGTPAPEAPVEQKAPAAAAEAQPEAEPAEGHTPEQKPTAAAAETGEAVKGEKPAEGQAPAEGETGGKPEASEPTAQPRRRGAKIIGRAPETVLREIRAAAEEKADRGKMVERLMAKSKVTPASGTSRKRRRGREDEGEDGGVPRGGKAPRKVMRKILREGGEIGGASARKGKGKGSPQPLRRAQTKVFNPVRRSRGGPQRAPQKKVRKTEATIELPATAKDVSNAMGIRANDIIKTAMENGVMITINDPMPQDLIEMVGLEYEIEITFTTPASTEEELAEELEREDKPEELKSRSPVVTMLGHVDHGKTSLLDAIRKTNVVSGEAGGITQHIGASRVRTPSGAMVTFLDTPGHAAFTQMRARGANITDIVVLVVAADDGVMPQTEEAINHAKAAEVPVLVAVNKMDLPAANMDRVKQQMSRFELIPEDWGGSTQFVPVSAVRGDGVEDLLERIALEAELLELKANPDKAALGRVVEAEVDPQSGVEATLLVQGGTLKAGDVVLAGSAYGRVRYLMDHRGKTVDEAGPAVPVRVFGFTDAPEAGQKFWVVPDIEKARAIAEQRKAAQRERAQQQRKL